MQSYLDQLASTDPASITDDDDRLAFWINAYNAYTVRLILTRYPNLSSITDFNEPWKQVRWTIGGEQYSLDQIEHEIIRVEFNEPRIHFAVNCAAASCPPLRDEAYVGDRLDAQLEEQTISFLNSPEGVVAESRGDRLTLRFSKLFDWYGEDFTQGGQSRIDYVRPYLQGRRQQLVERFNGRTDIAYLNYSWALNDAN